MLCFTGCHAAPKGYHSKHDGELLAAGHDGSRYSITLEDSAVIEMTC